MTKATLKRKMRWIVFCLIAVLVVALAAKLAEFGLLSLPLAEPKDLGKAIYEFLKDMAVVIVTIAAAYLAAILQRRSKFIESLEEEWREIVRTKSELFAYCTRQAPTHADYLSAFCRISETIDRMRIVYCNVGETDALVGLYPYMPLHDMRRALQTLDPDKRQDIGDEDRKRVREAILQCFYALRETFLEELDLEQPARPLLVAAGIRSKRPGATTRAWAAQAEQQAEQARLQRPNPSTDAMLQAEWEHERRRVAGADEVPAKR